MYDYMRRYIPQHIKTIFKRNTTIQQFLTCARNVEEHGRQTSFDCRTPCDDLELDVVSYSTFNTLVEEGGEEEEDDEFFMSVHFQVRGVNHFQISYLIGKKEAGRK